MLYLINAYSESIIHPLIDKQYIAAAHGPSDNRSMINSSCKFPQSTLICVGERCGAFGNAITADWNVKTKAFVPELYGIMYGLTPLWTKPPSPLPSPTLNTELKHKDVRFLANLFVHLACVWLCVTWTVVALKLIKRRPHWTYWHNCCQIKWSPWTGSQIKLNFNNRVIRELKLLAVEITHRMVD